MSEMVKNITNVRGIKCWGAHSGVKSMRRDLAIIYSEVPATAAAIYTQNDVVAEPIKLTKKHMEDGTAQVIVCNAGNANACTGEKGYEGAVAMAETAAEELNVKVEDVIIASTGLIGKPFPTKKIVNEIKTNASKLSNKSTAGSFAANAILTTDTFPKEGHEEFSLDNCAVNLAGIAKGSGMIHPNMATMLAFILTDVNIAQPLLQKAVKYCADRSFNMITIDGDTSTNDMVSVMANGLAENDLIENENDNRYLLFRDKLLNMMQHLAKLIVSDGEGASKFVQYQVTGAATEDKARTLVRAISSSTLVKTAMFGRDPNWGRIVSAAGNAGVNFDYTKANLHIGDKETKIQLLDQGTPVDFDRNYMKKLLRESHINVHLELNEGEGESTGWGSDMTTDYVIFNSTYTT